MPFLTPLRTEAIRGTNRRKLLEPLIYEAETWRLEVPAGTISNRANVPWLFRLLVPQDGKYRDAVWGHDFLFSEKGVFIRKLDGCSVDDYSRQTANAMMAEIMTDPELRVKGWRKFCISVGLKIGSWFSWKRG